MKSVFVLALLIGGSLIVSGQTPSQPAAQGTVSEDLNEAARAYRDANFEEALGFSERALAKDPQNKTAQQFIARILHRQYKPGDESPANVARAREAIEAYHRVLINQPDNEEAYKAISSLYGAIKEEELQRQWILQHATNSSVAPGLRADGYIVLASKDLHCSNMITELPANKETIVENRKAFVHYRRPRDDDDYQIVQRCVQSGLEMVGMAILLSPDDVAAWAYKTDLLLERTKLADMDGNVSEKALFTRQMQEASQRATELLAKQKKEQP